VYGCRKEQRNASSQTPNHGFIAANSTEIMALPSPAVWP
jgi:hypothetical protein